MFKTKWALLLAAALALPALAAACGGDDDGVGDDTGDDNGDDDGGGDVVMVSADIEGDTTWSSDKTYVLGKHIFLRSGTLTIEPGTLIKGQNDTSLVVTTGGRLVANGSSSEPVVFTSSQPVGARAAGDWGGVVLLGRAKINVAGGQESVEGFAAGTQGTSYGGEDDGHDCGSLEYVRIEFAGFELSPDKELNGLTVGGCGSDTNLANIQVHKGSDDGVEFFGGTASIRNLVISQPDDDGLDWDLGWTGSVQFLIVQQNPLVGNMGFESDSNENNADADPRSAPELWNVTLIGSGVEAGTAGKTQGAMHLRRGTAGVISNSIIAYFADFAIDVDGFASVLQAEEEGALAVRYTYFYQNAGDVDGGWPAGFDVKDGIENDCESPAIDCAGFDEEAFFAGDDSNQWADPDLVDPRNLASPNFAPSGDSPVLDGGDQPPAGFDTGATFFGAIGSSDWTQGWTAYPAD